MTQGKERIMADKTYTLLKTNPISQLSGYLTGCLLAAMPHMQDVRFHKSLIFLCGHDENGAMGLVINRHLEGLTLEDLFQQMDITPQEIHQNCPVYFGGPVEGGRGFVLHTSDYQQSSTLLIGEDYGITATVDILSSIAEGNGPREVILALGYAGWGPGQLDAEIQSNTWLQLEADEELIFRTPPSKKWEQAISKLGIEESMLTGDLGHA